MTHVDQIKFWASKRGYTNGYVFVHFPDGYYKRFVSTLKNVISYARCDNGSVLCLRNDMNDEKMKLCVLDAAFDTPLSDLPNRWCCFVVNKVNKK